MKREKGESNPFSYMLDEMCAALGVVGDTDKERIRQVAVALGVPPPEHDGPTAILTLFWYYLDDGR